MFTSLLSITVEASGPVDCTRTSFGQRLHLMRRSFSRTVQPEETKEGLTRKQVIVNLMKCAVGAGSFSVPYAFKVGGLVLIVLGA